MSQTETHEQRMAMRGQWVVRVSEYPSSAYLPQPPPPVVRYINSSMGPGYRKATIDDVRAYLEYCWQQLRKAQKEIAEMERCLSDLIIHEQHKE